MSVKLLIVIDLLVFLMLFYLAVFLKVKLLWNEKLGTRLIGTTVIFVLCLILPFHVMGLLRDKEYYGRLTNQSGKKKVSRIALYFRILKHSYFNFYELLDALIDGIRSSTSNSISEKKESAENNCNSYLITALIA